MNLEQAETTIMQSGPSRVVVDAEGYAVPSRRAREQHGIIPDIIFIRKDGWSLGTPAVHQKAAYGLWADEWVAYWIRGETCSRPIETYWPLWRIGEQQNDP